MILHRKQYIGCKLPLWTFTRDKRGLSVKEQSPEPEDNELTTKSQLLSSNRVIASAMLSIPVQAWKRKKKKRNLLLVESCTIFDFYASVTELFKPYDRKKTKSRTNITKTCIFLLFFKVVTEYLSCVHI